MAKATWQFPFGSPFQTCLSHRLILRIKQNNWEEGRHFSFKWQTDAKSWLELTHWKIPWCWERLKAGEGDNRGWDGWMASPTQQTWVWANSERWWKTGKLGVLQSMGSQRVRQTEWMNNFICKVSVQLQNYTTKRTTKTATNQPLY